MSSYVFVNLMVNFKRVRSYLSKGRETIVCYDLNKLGERRMIKNINGGTGVYMVSSEELN